MNQSISRSNLYEYLWVYDLAGQKNSRMTVSVAFAEQALCHRSHNFTIYTQLLTPARSVFRGEEVGLAHS